VDTTLSEIVEDDEDLFKDKLVQTCQIFAREQFGIRFGESTSFAEISITSTHILALTQHVNRSLGVNMSPTLFFATKNLKDLAHRLQLELYQQRQQQQEEKHQHHHHHQQHQQHQQVPHQQRQGQNDDIVSFRDSLLSKLPLSFIHHIGIACENLPSVRDWVCSTHDIVRVTGPIFDPLQIASLCLLTTSFGVAIELVSGPIVESLVKHSTSYYHVCYQVEDISRALKDILVDRSCFVVVGPVKALLFENRLVCFVSTPIGLIELLEEKESTALVFGSELSSLEFSQRVFFVSGKSCRLGNCNDVSELWSRVLVVSRNCITSYPLRTMADQSFVSKRVCDTQRWAGWFVENIDQFDAPFFSISPREVQGMDPQQRMLLQCSWDACGHVMDNRSNKNAIGVFVGINRDDYAMLISETTNCNPFGGTGVDHSVAAGRIAYWLNLVGPAVALSTACSSSLVAVSTALHHMKFPIQSPSCIDGVICGGVNLIRAPVYWHNFIAIGALSPNGQCRTFDASANGYVRSEGCVLLFVNVHADSSDCTRLLGGVQNHDGRSTGLTAPNGDAQARLLLQSMKHSRVKASQISRMETHGTGTSIGDPVECVALDESLRDTKANGAVRLLCGLKSLYGHCEAASGSLSLLSVLLSFCHELVVRHFSQSLLFLFY
jgi:3-oxoacyl-(acyl-carrier-protein) synthase